MDLRIKKTRRSIINAFLELRARKPLEKITVKELCEKAEINKSTFYTHFTDVFDLSNQLESDVIRQIVENLPHPNYVVEQPKVFTEELFAAFRSQASITGTLFSGSQSGHLIIQLNVALRELIFQTYPQYQDDPFFNIYLSYAIFGGYYAMRESRAYDERTIVSAISRITESSSKILFEEAAGSRPAENS